MAECLLRWSFIANQSSNVLPEYSVAQNSGLVHVEHNDRYFVVHAETERGRIHNLQTPCKRLGECETVVTLRVRKLVWVAIIDAIDLCGFEDHVGANLAGAQCCRCVSRKIRIARAGSENNNSAELQMSNSAPEDEWLGHVIHLNRGLDAGLDSHLLQRASQRESIDDCGKHSHVIRGRTIHASIGRRKSAPDIAAADHYSHFHAQIPHLFYAFGDLTHDGGRDIVAAAVLLHRFAAELEHDPFIDWCVCLHR